MADDLTVGEVYDTLNTEQKALLEQLVKVNRQHPLEADQIELFEYFLQETSFGEMTTAARRRSIRRRW